MPARVVHLTTVHQPFDPRIFHRECRTLADAGYDVHLVAPHIRDERRRGVTVHALPVGRGRRHRATLQCPAFRRARALGADVYHIHDPELLPLAYALRCATGARVVYDMHEDYGARGGAEGKGLRRLERWAFSRVDHVILSDATYAGIMRCSEVPATLVANFFRAPDAPLPTVEPDDGRPTMVYTGVHSRPRGLDHLVALARAVRREGLPWRLQLAGAAYIEPHRRWALDQIRRHDLGDVIAWDGAGRYLPWERLQAHHRRADVGLVLMHPTPAHRTCLPTKFYEYLHAGLPLLCSDVPLWRQFVRGHGCGVAVPPHDTDALLAVLHRWQDRAARDRRARAARAAAPRFIWPLMGRRLVGLYRTLA